MTKHEFKTTVANLSSRDQLILKTLFDTGMRTSELCNLRIKDIDFETGKGMIFEGKGSKNRILKVSIGLCKEIKDYLNK